MKRMNEFEEMNNDQLRELFRKKAKKAANKFFIQQQIVKSIEENNVEGLKNILINNSLNILDNLQYSKTNEEMHALHLAAFLGKTEIIEYLITTLGIGINKRAEGNYTALHYAAAEGYLSLAKKLVELNADVNLKDSEENTALHLSIEYGNTAVTEIILKVATINVNAQNERGETPLHLAAGKGEMVILMRLLLEKRADINLLDENGKTAFHRATEDDEFGEYYKDTNICKVLIYFSTSINDIINWIEDDQPAEDMVKEIIKDFIITKEFLTISAENLESLKFLNLYRYFVKNEPDGELKKLGEEYNIEEFIFNISEIIPGLCKVQNSDAELIPEVMNYIFYNFLDLNNHPEKKSQVTVQIEDIKDNIQVTGEVYTSSISEEAI